MLAGGRLGGYGAYWQLISKSPRKDFQAKTLKSETGLFPS